MKTELVTTLKRSATKILAELHESKEPVLITEHGLPSAYLLDVADYENMLKRMQILEGIALGERAILAKQTSSHAQATERLGEMAQIIWADTAITDLENIADYISLSNPAAAKALVQSLLNKIERLERFPLSGKIPTEIPELEYREIIAPPCRVFYRLADETVFIVHICREERDLRKLLAAQLE